MAEKKVAKKTSVVISDQNVLENSSLPAKEKLKRAHFNAFVKDFLKFLKEYSVIGIAMGLVIGAAVNTLVQSIVSGLITPFIQLIAPADFLKNLSYKVDGVTFAIGPIINALINFLIVALLFFLFTRVFLKKKEITKDSFK